MSNVDTTKLNTRPVQGYFTGMKEIKVTHIAVHMSPEFAHTLNHSAKFADGITDVIWRVRV
ncbi:MAG TPA: hypothetical protein VIY48_21975 [Candidatus Paceibacterota bacterium]